MSDSRKSIEQGRIEAVAHASDPKSAAQLETDEPTFIVQHDAAGSVMSEAVAYNKTFEAQALLKLLELGMKQVDEGKTIPAHEAFAALKARLKAQ